MNNFGTSQPVRRSEDRRFLTGQGRYIDDIAPKDALVARFYRADMAHARIKSLDLEEAQAMAGVHLVVAAEDLTDRVRNRMAYGVLAPDTEGTAVARDSSRAPRPVLAKDKVRFVGEPIAMVVAESAEIAQNALEAIVCDYEELPVSTGLQPAQSPAHALHEETPDNLVYDWSFGDQRAVEARFAEAAHKITLDLIDNRIICNSMEPRGCFAEPEGERLHFAFGGQGVWEMKADLAKMLDRPAESFRVTNPDVGGGFGMKGFAYPEYFAIADAALRLDRPVRWYADRSESMLSDNAGRGLETRAEAAFDADHRLIGLHIHSDADMGAYCSGYAQFIQTELALKVLTGVYDIQDVYFSGRGYYTNTTQVDAYRGAGRPEAIYVIERLLDKAARELGVSPFALKEKNFISADQMPYESASHEIYDVGNFAHVLKKGMEYADVEGFSSRKKQSSDNGKLRGIGLCYYIESILGAQNESTRLHFADDGMVEIYVGTQSNGQGHETVFAQILHQRAGIPFERIRFMQGDSDLIAKGGGTGGSRSVTMQGNSINACADIMVEKFRPLAEEELEAAAADLVFEEGAFVIAGTDARVSLMDLAQKARAKGIEELLTTENEHTVPGRSYPNGCHIAEVEVDPETGVTQVVKYTMCDDFGVLMNPMLAEGQAHGGVAQGIGQALCEHVVYDEDGQLLTGSFMDYAMPRADDIPMMPFYSEPVPSTRNAIGMKGCGEAGTVGALAAVTNAALDAVWDQGVRQVDMPLTPLSMWQRLQDAKA